jgi:putative membrane protein
MFNFTGFVGVAGVAVIATLRILIFVAIVTFFIKQYKKLGGGRSNALKILDEKYVNGEISDEEYINKKSVLTQQ